jgi:hypothetical protein
LASIEKSTLFVVKYTGPFGFIKPWTAVRDSETFSQQFLTPSIVEGIEKKLFPELLVERGIHAIAGHRLRYLGIAGQQETTWSKAWITKRGAEKGTFNQRPSTGILTRGVLIEPVLFLAFKTEDYAERASKQHICLCRNEDLLWPEKPELMDMEAWGNINGFELLFEPGIQSGFNVGFNRFDDNNAMYGRLVSVGNPIGAQ